MQVNKSNPLSKSSDKEPFILDSRIHSYEVYSEFLRIEDPRFTFHCAVLLSIICELQMSSKIAFASRAYYAKHMRIRNSSKVTPHTKKLHDLGYIKFDLNQKFYKDKPNRIRITVLTHNIIKQRIKEGGGTIWGGVQMGSHILSKDSSKIPQPELAPMKKMKRWGKDGSLPDNLEYCREI